MRPIFENFNFYEIVKIQNPKLVYDNKIENLNLPWQ